MALSADAHLDRKESGPYQVYPVAASTTIYAGGLLVVDSTGYAEPLTDAVDKRYIGVAYEGVDNSSGSDGDKNVRVYGIGRFKVTATSITQAMVGQMMYGADDATMDDTSTNKVPVGRLVEYVSSTSGWIEIGPATGLKTEVLELLQGVCAAPGSDWTESSAGVELAQNKTNGLAYLRASGLQVGDVITSVQLAGGIGATTSNATVLIATLQNVVGAAGGSTVATLQAMDTVTKEADYAVDETKDLASAHTVVTDESIQLKLDGTTADNAACDIDVTGWSLTVQRAVHAA